MHTTEVMSGAFVCLSYGGTPRPSEALRTRNPKGRTMDRELIQDCLKRSGMDAAQADALSRIVADIEARLVTKQDLAGVKAELKEDFAGVKAERKADFAGLREEFTNLKAGIKGDLKSEIASLRAALTLQFIAMTGFLPLARLLVLDHAQTPLSPR